MKTREECEKDEVVIVPGDWSIELTLWPLDSSVSLAALFLGNTITVVGVRLGFVDRHTTAREKVELNFNSNERRQ